ncbi:MAG: J domain-containing protein [Anaerofustis sp.]
MLPINTDQFAELIKELNAMKNALAQLLAEKEYMLVYDTVRLEAEYMEKVGHLEYTIFHLDLKLKKLLRKIEIVRSKIAGNEPINLKMIDEQIEREFSQEKKEESKRSDHMCFVEEENKKQKKLSKENQKTLKEMYYKLAKKLHPDINPDITEQELALWHRVQRAYENRDLEEMTMLYEMYEQVLELESELTEREEIVKRIEKIRELIKQTLADIAAIKTTFPFTFEEKLRDEDWLFGKNAINNQLYRQLKQEYGIHYEQLRMMLSSVGILYF